MAQTTTIPHAEPKGIAGWLILPMLITLTSPPFISGQTYVTIAFALKEDLPSGLRMFVIGESVFNVVLIVGWIVSAVWLFRHKRSFPSLFIAMLVVTFVGLVADSLIALYVFDIPLGPEDYPVRALANLIWAPYMAKSKRVRNTFIES